MTKPEIQPNSVANIVFDLGGVLIEWHPEKIVESAFRDPKVQTTVLKKVFFHSDWRAFDAGEMTEEEAVTRFAETTGRPPAELGRLFDDYRDALVPYSYTEPLLQRLVSRGFRLFVLSNIHSGIMTHLLERFPFWHHFRGIVASGAVGLSKPDPAVFRYLLSTYHLNPEQTLLVDDTEENIDGAESVGMRGILFTTVDDLERILAL